MLLVKYLSGASFLFYDCWVIFPQKSDSVYINTSRYLLFSNYLKLIWQRKEKHSSSKENNQTKKCA